MSGRYLGHKFGRNGGVYIVRISGPYLCVPTSLLPLRWIPQRAAAFNEDTLTITIILVCYVHLAPASDRIVALTRLRSIIPRRRGNQYSRRQIALPWCIFIQAIEEGNSFSCRLRSPIGDPTTWREYFLLFRLQPLIVNLMKKLRPTFSTKI